MLPGRLQGTDIHELAICARRSLSFFDLEDLAERKPAQLSMGQKRLGGIARTLTCPADLLILDEPTSSLDVRQRERVASVFLAQKREQHKTIIFSTHYLPDASAADTVVVIQDGKIARRLSMGINREENLSAILHNLTQILPLAPESTA